MRYNEKILVITEQELKKLLEQIELFRNSFKFKKGTNNNIGLIMPLKKEENTNSKNIATFEIDWERTNKLGKLNIGWDAPVYRRGK